MRTVTAPEPATGTHQLSTLPLVRVSASLAADSWCPHGQSVKTRVSDRYPPRPRRRRTEGSDFLFDPLFDALDAFEVDGVTREDAIEQMQAIESIGVAEGAWLTHAISRYPDFRQDGLLAVPGLWVIHGVAPDSRRELYAWGRSYASEDGSRRVHVFPTSTGRTPEPAKVAVAAFTTAFGRLATRPSRWWLPFAPVSAADTFPTEVVVRSVSLYDGSFVDLFVGSREEAKDFYDTAGRPNAARAVAGGARVPGSNCCGCKLLDLCNAVPRTPGLLRLSDPAAPLRSVSATTLRYHAQCPRQMRLREQNLPSGRTESDPIRIGRIVDSALDELHRDTSTPPCTSARVDEALATRKDLAASDRARAAHLLGLHVDVCPWIAGVATTPRPQAEVVAFDADASALIVAKPDLLYIEDGELVWRETTTSRHALWGATSLFESRKKLQLALALLLCAAGAVAMDRRVARIEVEYLTDNGADLRILDPHDQETQEEARQVIDAVAPAWFADGSFPARPGVACASCAYSEWCPDAVESEDRADDGS